MIFGGLRILLRCILKAATHAKFGWLNDRFWGFLATQSGLNVLPNQPSKPNSGTRPETRLEAPGQAVFSPGKIEVLPSDQSRLSILAGNRGIVFRLRLLLC
jgi:hypothetical protein